MSNNDLKNPDRNEKTIFGNPALIGAVSLGGILLALAVDALAIEPFRLGVTHPRLVCSRLPPALDGLSVLLLADLHASHWGRREKRFLKLLETVERPDIIVWDGDLITGKEGRTVALDICRRVWELFPDCPTFITLGNGEHKIGGKECRAFVELLRASDFEVLINENRTVILRGESLTVAGTDDPYYGFADIERSLRGAPEGQFQLLLAHSPQVAGVAARLGVDAMLSGHTHGGQVRLPFLGAVRTQNPLGLKMDYGIFDRKRLAGILGRDPGGDLVTYITRGIGAAQVPFFHWLAPRFLCPPEISRVILCCGDSSQT